MIATRCCGERSVGSTMYAVDPVIDAAEPAPIRSRTAARRRDHTAHQAGAGGAGRVSVPYRGRHAAPRVGEPAERQVEHDPRERQRMSRPTPVAPRPSAAQMWGHWDHLADAHVEHQLRATSRPTVRGSSGSSRSGDSSRPQRRRRRRLEGFSGPLCTPRTRQHRPRSRGRAHATRAAGGPQPQRRAAEERAAARGAQHRRGGRGATRTWTSHTGSQHTRRWTPSFRAAIVRPPAWLPPLRNFRDGARIHAMLVSIDLSSSETTTGRGSRRLGAGRCRCSAVLRSSTCSGAMKRQRLEPPRSRGCAGDAAATRPTSQPRGPTPPRGVISAALRRASARRTGSRSGGGGGGTAAAAAAAQRRRRRLVGHSGGGSSRRLTCGRT